MGFPVPEMYASITGTWGRRAILIATTLGKLGQADKRFTGLVTPPVHLHLVWIFCGLRPQNPGVVSTLTEPVSSGKVYVPAHTCTYMLYSHGGIW